MAFIDRKEEILNIVLTKHGRDMLANGKFRPKYYCFSDDEVDYQNYTGVSIPDGTPLTGTEETRINNIQDDWLVFEPLTNENIAIQNKLFTVPLGQKYYPQLEIVSGSFSSSNQGIQFEKEVHIFHKYDNTMDVFTKENIGDKSIVFVREIPTGEVVTDSTGTPVIILKDIEIHAINTPTGKVYFDYIDYDEKDGFIVDVYLSGTNGKLTKLYKNSKFDKNGNIIIDTYLKYFSLIGDEK